MFTFHTKNGKDNIKSHTNKSIKTGGENKMKKRLISLLFAGIMACSVIGSGVTTYAADDDSHINLALFTYIEGMDPATDWCGWNSTR